MQPSVYNFVKKHAKQGRILDIGSLDVNGNVRDLFTGSEYTGLDMRAGDNVDVVANAHKLPYDDNYFDVVVCLEMLEHDDNPFLTASEIRRILKREGQIIVCASGIGMHKHDNPSDFWRFTREGLLTLFKDFQQIETIEMNQEVFLSGIKTDNIVSDVRVSTNNGMVSIIIPVIRPESAARCIEAIKENAGIPPETYEIIYETDINKIGCPEMVKQLVSKTKYDFVMFLGDDTVPQPGFLKEAIKAMEKLPDGWGVVGLNTEGPTFLNIQDQNIPSNSNPIAHWLAHKKILDYIPGGDFFSTEYRHSWGDGEIYDIAFGLGRWTFAEKAIILHDHPVNGRGLWDEGLEVAYSEKNVAGDRKTYLRRKRDRAVEADGVRLGIGVPLTDLMVYSQFMFSFLRLDFPSASNLLMPNYPGQIDVVRNDLAKQSLELGCTHVLFMDTDQIYLDKGMVQKMLGHNESIVGAMVHRRYPPFDPLLMRGETSKLSGVPDDEILRDGVFSDLVPVDRTGSGCIMVDTSVFLEMEYPWFELRKNPNGTPVGEDFAFCEKARTAGFSIFVDCSIRIQHLSLMAVDWSTYKLYEKVKKGRT